MSFLDKYPYTDFHELNLDWFLEQFKTVTDEWAEMKEDFHTLEETVQQFTSFVTNYFNNLDVQQEINNKLDQMVEDGTMTELLTPIFNNYKAEIDAEVNEQGRKISVLEGRMDEFASLTEGSTTGDAELMDIRVGADGYIYPTAGDAVRGQVDSLNSDINTGETELEKSITWIDAYVSTAGNVVSSALSKSGIFTLNKGETVYVGTRNPNICIIGETDSTSINVGDSITVIQRTSGTDQFESYSYTAPSTKNIVVCVLKSNYTLKIKKKTQTQLLLDNVSKRLDLVDTGTITNNTQNAKYVYFNDLDIQSGEKFIVNINLVSGSSSDILLYANNVEDNPFATFTYGETKEFSLDVDLTRIIGYARSFVTGSVISGTVRTLSDLEKIDEQMETLDERMDALEDGFPVLPEYADAMVESINETLEELQNSESVSIAFITDIHVAGGTLADKTQYAMNVSKDALNKINAFNPIDLCMINGDYLYNGVEQTKEASIECYKGLDGSFNKINPVQWRAKGNHDDNDIAGTTTEALTDEEVYQLFLKYEDINSFVMDYGHLEKAYGYFDIPNKKIRCIMINTVDVPYIVNEDDEILYTQQHTKGISNRQLNFVADALKISDDGWGVVFFSHHALQNNEVINPTASSDAYLTPEHGGTPLMGVINAFMNKTSYTYTSSVTNWEYDVDVDYTENGSDEVIGMFCGHTHRDEITTVNGYVLATTTAASFVYTGYNSEGQAYSRTARTATETSWDIITIDRNAKKVYMTRYGAGVDREQSYGS